MSAHKPNPASRVSDGIPQRVLIVRVGAMGDVLHGMAAVAAIRAAFPGAEIGWAVEPRWEPLLRSGEDASARTPMMPLVDRVHRVPAREWSRAPFSRATVQSVLALRRELRACRYDVAIDLQGSIRSAVIARMSGAPRVVGPAAPRERPAAWMYTERVPLHSMHVVEQAGEIASAGLKTTLPPATASLPRDAAAEAWCEQRLQGGPGAMGNGRKPVVLLAPTAGWGAKQWPADRFGALAALLAGKGFRVLVNASAAGDGVQADVVRSSGGAAEVVVCSIPELAALLRRTSLVVAGDTGPLHLAAAMGVPVVALFGPTDPARNGPYGTKARVLRSASSVTDHRRHPTAEAGLAQIPVTAVAEAAADLLGFPLEHVAGPDEGPQPRQPA